LTAVPAPVRLVGKEGFVVHEKGIYRRKKSAELADDGETVGIDVAPVRAQECNHGTYRTHSGFKKEVKKSPDL